MLTNNKSIGILLILSVLYGFSLESAFQITRFDITKLAFALLLMYVLVAIVVDGKIITFKTVDWVFAAYAMIVIGLAVFQGNAMNTQYIITAILPYFAARYMLVSEDGKLIRWINAFSLAIIGPILLNFVKYKDLGLSRITVGDASPIGIGENISFFILANYFLIRTSTKSTKVLRSIQYAAIMLGFFCQIAVLGTRGATLSTVASILIFEFLYFSKKNMMILSTIIAIGYGIFNANISLITRVLPIANRFSLHSMLNSVSVKGSSQFIGREQLQSWTVASIEKYPITGVGFGKYYPHNIILEVLSAIGIVGLLVFVIGIAWSFGHMMQLKSNPNILILLSISALLYRMTSFDYVAHKTLFLLIGLMVSNYQYKLRICNENESNEYRNDNS
jgi:hypothetical protein